MAFWDRFIAARDGHPALLKVLVFLSIILTFAAAVYVAINVSVFWGIVIAFAVLLIAPLVYLLMAVLLVLIMTPFHRGLDRSDDHTW